MSRLSLQWLKGEKKIRSRKEIEEKYEELNERMREISAKGDIFNVASTDGQRYILEWVLMQH